jgi:phosphoglycolate phosphatase
MFRLIVFDLDGTLVDSRRDLAESANEVLAAYGGGPLAEEALGRMVGDGAATLVARAFAAAGCAQPPEALERFLGIYNRRLLRFTRPYPGISEALSTLADRASLALLTNKPAAPAREILAGLGLLAFFESGAIVGGDGPFPRKPDPAGLLHLSSSAGVAPAETVLVGDSLIDWQTTRAAGTGICLAKYGFGFNGVPVGVAGQSDLAVDAPADLPVVL